MDSNSRTLRGLSIATLIFAILGILLGLLLCAAFGLSMGTMVADPSYLSSGFNEAIASDPDLEAQLAAAGMTADDVLGASAGIMIVMFGMCAFYTLACILCLVPSILGIKNAKNRNKLKGCFVWSIICAVLCFLSGRLVSMILLIIMAVFANRVRKTPVIPFGQSIPSYAQNAYGQNMNDGPGMYANQPYYGAAAQPQTGSFQPVQPGTPQAGAQQASPYEYNQPIVNQQGSVLYQQDNQK